MVNLPSAGEPGVGLPDCSSLVADLRRLGVTGGDTIMVHASLRAIGPVEGGPVEGGPVEGGAVSVVEALDEAVGPGGRWLMVLATVEAGPGVVFDHLLSPADPDVGVLAEVFRRHPGTVVNDHPEARFGVRGRDPGELLADLPWDDYFGPGSVLERLCDADGKVLRLGSNLDTVTLIHYAEYVAPVANKRRVRRHSVVARPEGPTAVVVECLDDSTGIVDWPGEDYFITLTREYLASGRALGIGPVGGATSELLDARDLVAFAAQWMAERFRSG